MAEFTSPFEVCHFLNLSSVVYKAQPSWSHTGKSIGIEHGLRDALEVGQSMSLVFWVGKMERQWEVKFDRVMPSDDWCMSEWIWASDSSNYLAIAMRSLRHLRAWVNFETSFAHALSFIPFLFPCCLPWTSSSVVLVIDSFPQLSLPPNLQCGREVLLISSMCTAFKAPCTARPGGRWVWDWVPSEWNQRYK